MKHVIARMTGVYGPFREHDRAVHVREPSRPGLRGRDRGQRRPGEATVAARDGAEELGPANQRAIELTMHREALADPADGGIGR